MTKPFADFFAQLTGLVINLLTPIRLDTRHPGMRPQRDYVRAPQD